MRNVARLPVSLDLLREVLYLPEDTRILRCSMDEFEGSIVFVIEQQDLKPVEPFECLPVVNAEIHKEQTRFVRWIQ